MKRYIKRIPGTMPDPIVSILEKATDKQRSKQRERNHFPFPDPCKNQNHVIGIFYNYDDTDLVRVKERVDLLDRDFHPFRFCPHCGKNVVRLNKKLFRGK
jgi:hypothetical protein